MPGSVSLIHMHALLESYYAISTYIFHCFALCRGPKWGSLAQCSHPIYVPECACLNGHSLKPFNKCFQKVWFVNSDFFIKSFIYDKIYEYILVGALMFFSSKIGEFDRFFNRFDRPVEESRTDRFPPLPRMSPFLATPLFLMSYLFATEHFALTITEFLFCF